MNTNQLAAALRNKAAEVRNINAVSDEEDQLLRDAADMMRVLAHMVDGMPLAKAFGSPGDWGYDTPIGQALFAVPETPNDAIKAGGVKGP